MQRILNPCFLNSVSEGLVLFIYRAVIGREDHLSRSVPGTPFLLVLDGNDLIGRKASIRYQTRH